MLSRRKNKIMQKRRMSAGNFLFFGTGMLAGLLLFFTTVLTVTLNNTSGINVYLQGETVLGIVNQEVERQMQKEFPVLMGGIKAEVPFLVEKYTQDFISFGKLEIGGYTVNLPPQFIQELEDDLRRDVTYYVLEVLQNLENQKFVEEFSKSIKEDVLKVFISNLNGQIIRIPLTKYYSIPVTVWLN